VFALGRAFNAILMFASKAGVYPSEVLSLVVHSRVGSRGQSYKRFDGRNLQIIVIS
jgi:hypothetical protein